MKQLKTKQTIILLALFTHAFLTACANAPRKPDTLVSGDYSYTIDHARWLVGREMSKNKVDMDFHYDIQGTRFF